MNDSEYLEKMLLSELRAVLALGSNSAKRWQEVATMSLEDLGLDSLDVVEFMMRVEAEAEVDLGCEFSSGDTLQKVHDLLMKRLES